MKNIKVGDRVRCIDKGDYNYVTKGNIYQVYEVDDEYFGLIGDDKHTHFGYEFEDFEPVTKTLDNLEVGDVLVDGDSDEYFVLDTSKNDKLFALSVCGIFDSFESWYTLEEIKKCYKLKESEELEPKVKKAIKLLEEKGYKVEK